MVDPPSRQYEASQDTSGGPYAEYDPHGVAAQGMVAQCPDCPARDGMGPPWFGSNLWSAPGTARALDYSAMESGAHVLGVCGASPKNALNDYNMHGHWGMSAKKTVAAGEVVDLSWCVATDHGGVPMFRLCSDKALVSAVMTPGYAATTGELEALEQCFQRGLLRCDSVESMDRAPRQLVRAERGAVRKLRGRDGVVLVDRRRGRPGAARPGPDAEAHLPPDAAADAPYR